MRVLPRSAAASVAALVLGLVLSFGAAVWLRAVAPGPDALWRHAAPAQMAVWVQAAAHGAPVELSGGAEISSERLRRITGFFGRDAEVGGEVGVLLVPGTILLAVAAVFVAGGRRSGARDDGEILTAAAGAAAVYGIALGVLAALATWRTGVGGRIVAAGAEAGVNPWTAGVLAALWAGALTGAGAASVRDRWSPSTRALGGAWARAVAAGAGTAAIVLVVWAASRGETGDADPALIALGVLLLLPNAVGSALVAAHGAPMLVSIDAGPLSGWRRIDYLHGTADGDPAVLGWLFLLVPLAAGLVAGRALGRRMPGPGAWPPFAPAAAFGALWGATLCALAILLRVRMASSFGIGRVAPAGEVAIDPFAALLAGIVWGTAVAYLGMLTVSGRAPVPQGSG